MHTSFYLLLVAFLVLCLFMCGLVLIQRGRGGGLASAFGGAGANTAFGSKTGDVLTWTTAIVFGVFVAMTIGLNIMAEKIHNGRKPAAVVTQATPPSTTGPTRAVPTDELPTNSEPTESAPVESTPVPVETMPAPAATESPESPAPTTAPAN